MIQGRDSFIILSEEDILKLLKFRDKIMIYMIKEKRSDKVFVDAFSLITDMRREIERED